MVISPEGLLNEATALRYQHGIYDAFSLLTVDENALCATPYHGIASRLNELARGDNPRGTIGTGVGEAYRDLNRVPELALTAGDLTSPDLRERLALVREHVRHTLQPIIEGEFLAGDRVAADDEIRLLYDDGFLDYVVTRFTEASHLTNIVSHDFLGEVILSRKGAAVVETSHGVLSDRLTGFYPHVSAIRTLPRFTHAMFEEAGFTGQLVDIGVTRAYAIRHGAGPMPTADPTMAEHLLPGSNKDANRYQGEVRVGPLDFVLLRYALQACGGPTAFDGLAITWFDQIKTNGRWDFCNRYDGADDPIYFSPQGELRLADDQTHEHQTALGQKLLDCKPKVTSLPIAAEADNNQLYATCENVFADALNVPVRMVSFGATELDKLCK
jgi:adenylosuccinate synthase